MKKLLFPALTAFICICYFQSYSQKKIIQNQSKQLLRCGTTEHLEKYFRENPQARAIFEQNKKAIPNAVAINARTYRSTAIVTVPVVVHIVLINPNIITDADVQWQINKMNEDYAGVNADSTNEPAAFQAVRGHTQIRFCLAQRTPNGTLTNGIDRVASNTQSMATQTVDPIKRSSSGGADIWDPDLYLNMWVGRDGSGMGLLGYSHYPGAGSPDDDGVFINYQGFGKNPCYTAPLYNLGRTAVHEVGHYFGLYHIWGDESGCNGDDFQQLPGTCLLPTGLFNPLGQGNTTSDIGDTPNQADATFNCPGGVTTDACATSPPGKMFQDFMDYTADACYSMFTAVQVARMQWVLDNCRPSLKTSLACSPPAIVNTLDVSPVETVNPGGYELSGCENIIYPSTLACGFLVPKIRIKNNGTNTINSLTVTYIIDNGAPVFQNLNVTIPSVGSVVVALTPVTLSVGPHLLKFFTSNPNGSSDQDPSNDTLSTNFTVGAGTIIPLVEGFESITFPPDSFMIVNPDNDFTWIRKTPGNNSIAAAFIDNFNNSSQGTIDEIRTPSLSVNSTDSIIIMFDVAHKNFPGSPDELSVLVSKDCGVSFTTIYSKSGAELATAGSSTSEYTIPFINDWRRERIVIGGAMISSGQIILAFRNKNDYGNNIWIDNINISKKVNLDLMVLDIIKPKVNECSSNIQPQVIIGNVGIEDVATFKVGFSIDVGSPIIVSFNQTIPAGGSTSVTLPAVINDPGNHTITAFTADPASINATGDQNTTNDTTIKSFNINRILNSPVTENFEAPVFPPANWTLHNPDRNNTWVRTSPGRNSRWAAFIDNFNSNTVGQVDELKSPEFNVTGADSLIFKFDLAHKYFSSSIQDTLTILVSTDCGYSYVPIYKKWGASLATAGQSDQAYISPAPADWRTERISLDNSFVNSGTANFLVRNTNDYGNNIFIDNINIEGVFKRDISIVDIHQPANIVCSPELTPSVTIQNKGIETITSFKVSYSIDGGTLSETVVSGVSMQRDSSIIISLNNATIGMGSHNIKIFTSEPVSFSGTGDQNSGNDTLTKIFTLAGSVQAPLSEGFENTTFPPANWAVVNPDASFTWSRSTSANAGTGSVFINNYNYNSLGAMDELYSPLIDYTGVDSVKLQFDLAAATYSYPGSTEIPLDTLEILVTTDCGNTFTTVYKKWGEDLQTINDPNFPQTFEFFPTSKSKWRTEQIDLTSFTPNGPIQLVFRNTSNFENNIFIDNVNLTTKILPTRLKNDGYLLLPNPFHTQFAVWHYQQPTNLRFIAIYNATGQLVWSRQFSGEADKYITIDLSNTAPGIYLINLGYEENKRIVSQRIVKY